MQCWVLRPGTSAEAVTVGDRYTSATIHHHPARTLSGPGWSPPPPRSMNTTFQAALKADWAPAIESTARFVGVAIACVIVAADWLRFTWQHPWAGLRALEFPGAATSSPNLTTSSPNLAVSSPNLAVSLAVSSPQSAASSPRSAASSPRSERVAPLLLLPAPAFPLLAPAPEPIAPVPAPRKRGRRATRQPKAA